MTWQHPSDAPAATDNRASDPPPLFRAARAGSAIGLSTVAALVVGFLLQLSIAYRFGAGSDTDAFFMAQGTSELLGKILLGGSLTSVFLPLFVEYLTNGEPQRAWRLANHLMHLAVVVFLLAIGIMALFTDRLVSLLAPGFPPDVHVTTVLLLRIMLPAFLFLFITDLATAILNSFRVFGLPALSRLMIPLLSLLLLGTVGSRFGIVVLAVGTLLGAAFQIGLVVVALVRSGFVYEPMFSLRDPDVRRVLTLVAPFAFSVLAAQAAGVIYRIIVSHFPEGSLSALKFGDKLSQITNTLFFSSITTIAFPAFSRAVATRAWEDIRTTFEQAMRIMAFVGIPLTVGIALLRMPLVRLLYQRGSFTPEDTAATAGVLGILLIGLVANGVSSLLGHLALALKVTRISVLATILAQLVTIGLFLTLGPRLGIFGLALGSAISPFILAFLYAVFLRRQVPRLWTVLMNPVLAKLGVSAVALAVGVHIGGQLAVLVPPGAMRDFTMLAAGGVCGAGAYLATAWGLGVTEIRLLGHIVYYATRRVWV